MRISIVGSTSTHEIRFFEFRAPSGWTITSFFQIVEKPDTGIGCVDTFHEALELINYPSSKAKAYIEATYPLSLGISEFDCVASSSCSGGSSCILSDRSRPSL